MPNTFNEKLLELKQIFAQANQIIGEFPNEVRDALLNFHADDTNLVHVSEWGERSSSGLIESIKEGDVALILYGSSLRLAHIDKPYKATVFPDSRDEYRFNNEVIYVAEYGGAFTAANFVDLVKGHLSQKDLGSMTQDEILSLTLNVWSSCIWQHPATVIDEDGIDFFKPDEGGQSLA